MKEDILKITIFGREDGEFSEFKMQVDTTRSYPNKTGTHFIQELLLNQKMVAKIELPTYRKKK